MKRTLGLLLLAGMVFLPTASAQNLARRQARQQARIVDGVRDGDLTRKETRRLERSQTRIHREIRRDRADGRGLTAHERNKANRMLDRQSNRIGRARHN